jgi:hypothetical protein
MRTSCRGNGTATAVQDVRVTTDRHLEIHEYLPGLTEAEAGLGF